MSGTSIPTVSQVKAWDLDALARQGTYWTQQAARFTTDLDNAYNAVGNSVDYLVGKFGTAARDKGMVIRDQGYKAAGALETAGQAIALGVEPLRFAKTTVTDLLATITAGGYLWGEDGTVTVSLSQLANAMSDKDSASAAIKLAALQRQAEQYTSSLQAGLIAAGAMADSVATGINEAMAELPSHGPGVENPAVDGTTGERLGAQVNSSDQIPPEVLDQVDTILDQVTLTDEEQAALQDGRSVVVPASTLEFTQRFLDTAGPEGFSRLSEQLNSQGPEGQAKAQALANSFMLLSNENVKGVKADGKQIEGGYEQLPQEYRDLISSRVVEFPTAQQPGEPGHLPDGNTITYPDPDNVGQYRAGLAHYENLRGLTTALSLADEGYTPGTKLSTELYRQGGFLAEVVTDPGTQRALPSDPAVLQDTIRNTVEVASRNTDASAIIFTGEGTPEQLGADYRRDATVMALAQHDWPEGVENSPVQKMFNWIPENAHVEVPPGHPDYQSQLADATQAGKSARALADIISSAKSPDGVNNFDTLFKDDNTAERYIAKALVPYVGNMVDVDENLVGTHGFGTLNPVEATRVFALMNADGEGGALLNGAAIATAYEFDRAFARGDGGQDLAVYSGRLQGLVEGGLAAEIGLNNYDATAEYNHRKELYGASYLAAKEWINLPVKLLPGEKYIWSPMIASIEAFGKDPAVAALNDKPDLSYPVLNFEMPDGHDNDPSPGDTSERHRAAQRYVMLQALIDNGRFDPSTLPEDLSDGAGGLKPFDHMKSTEATQIPKILEDCGVEGLGQYVDDNTLGSQIVREVVFGGERVEPGNQIFVPVLRAGAAPAVANRWDVS
ncbi:MULTISPECIES: hypothetical protein [unclassified Nocardia]|uniref:TPR repeat region-containing protein n=1 Tax=unclassified Nocardia TaxID=2637762 RepID=UPI00278C5576|nr:MULTISPECIES: hypothetical protein [unclassified Nocardia]